MRKRQEKFYIQDSFAKTIFFPDFAVIPLMKCIKKLRLDKFKRKVLINPLETSGHQNVYDLVDLK